MQRSRRVVVVLVVAVALFAGQHTSASGIDRSATVAPDNGRACRTSRLPVTLETGLPVAPGAAAALPTGTAAGPQDVLVKLCLPEGAVPTTVQVLVHGITYDHRYWNIADPDAPTADTYSWEAAAAKAGYATLALDRIGNGQSSRPLSAFVDMGANASVVQQVVRALRDGRVPAPGDRVAFERVVLVGHSYGSMTSWYTASHYQDVDALVVTSATHNLREVPAPVSVEGNSYPAMLDPQFAGMGLDPGYITSRPGTRALLFYKAWESDPSTTADPRIIERDEATKGTVSQFEIVNYPLLLRTPHDIRVPVLVVIGDRDQLFCSLHPIDLGAPCGSPEALIVSEAPWYGPHASLDAIVLPGAGHNINALPGAPDAFRGAMRWLTATVPPGG